MECLDDAEDRRAKLVRITGRGLAVCRDTEANIRLSEARMLRYLTDGEKETLVQLLTKVYRGISEPSERP